MSRHGYDTEAGVFLATRPRFLVNTEIRSPKVEVRNHSEWPQESAR